MQVHTFTADSPAEAVEQIRQQLGPEAVVLEVRGLPGKGLGRLWRKRRLEVCACRPEPAASPPAAAVLAELREELAEIKQKINVHQSQRSSPAAERVPTDSRDAVAQKLQLRPIGRDPASVESSSPSKVLAWESPYSQLGRLLEHSGLLPVHVQRVVDEVQSASEPGGRASDSGWSGWPDGGAIQPTFPSLATQLKIARAVLVGLWRPFTCGGSNRHVFIGPSGSGKTTVLSKWLAQSVLVEGRRARVWRLDGLAANTAEALSVFAEVLGVPVQRLESDSAPADPSELVLIDLPGVNCKDTAELEDLSRRLAALTGAQVHLVLNAAYEGEWLLAQARAFAQFPVQDLILTHLDEEPRWGKIWNLLLGTNYTVSFLSSGQKVPGEFVTADPVRLLAAHFPAE